MRSARLLAAIATKGGWVPLPQGCLGRHHHTMPHGRLMVPVLAGFAEFKRELIVARTSEGQAHGVKFGPRFKLSVEQRACERAKGEGIGHLARILGVSRATIGRIPATTP